MDTSHTYYDESTGLWTDYTKGPNIGLNKIGLKYCLNQCIPDFIISPFNRITVGYSDYVLGDFLNNLMSSIDYEQPIITIFQKWHNIATYDEKGNIISHSVMAVGYKIKEYSNNINDISMIIVHNGEQNYMKTKEYVTINELGKWKLKSYVLSNNL
jgi:hypothetical protein